jgi:hypothetical protein
MRFGRRGRKLAGRPEDGGSTCRCPAASPHPLTAAVAFAIPTDAVDVCVVVVIHTITGGSGRLEGATGGFRVERFVNTAAGVAAGWFRGTLVLNNAK